MKIAQFHVFCLLNVLRRYRIFTWRDINKKGGFLQLISPFGEGSSLVSSSSTLFCEVFFHGYPIEFCPSFGKFILLFFWNIPVYHCDLCPFGGFAQGQFQLRGWVVFRPICGCPFLHYSFSRFQFQVFSRDISFPSCEFPAHVGFPCGFAASEFRMFFGVYESFVDLLWSCWDDNFLFYDGDFCLHWFSPLHTTNMGEN